MNSIIGLGLLLKYITFYCAIESLDFGELSFGNSVFYASKYIYYYVRRLGVGKHVWVNRIY